MNIAICVGIRRGFDGLLGDDEVIGSADAILIPEIPDSDTIATARDIGISLGD